MVNASHTICSRYLMRSVSDLFLADPQLRATTISGQMGGRDHMCSLAQAAWFRFRVDMVADVPMRALDGNVYLNVNLTYALCFTGYVVPLASLYLRTLGSIWRTRYVLIMPLKHASLGHTSRRHAVVMPPSCRGLVAAWLASLEAVLCRTMSGTGSQHIPGDRGRRQSRAVIELPKTGHPPPPETPPGWGGGCDVQRMSGFSGEGGGVLCHEECKVCAV